MTDAELLKACADGDEKALRELFVRTRAGVTEACSVFLGGHAALPAAVAGTYARAFAARPSARPELTLADQLSALAARECFTVLRGLRRDYDEQTGMLEALSGSIPTLVEISEDPKERVNFMIRGDIEDIPEQHRQVLALSELEGLHPMAIAKRRGCSWAVALRDLIQARQALAKQVQESFGL